MDHFRRQLHPHKPALPNTLAPGTGVTWSSNAMPSIGPMRYTGLAPLSQPGTFNMAAPAVSPRPGTGTILHERLRLVLVLTATLLYAVLLLYVLSLSSSPARPSVGLSAQRDNTGVWRVTSLVPGGLSYDMEVHIGDTVMSAYDATGNAIDLKALPESTSNFQTAYALRVRSESKPEAEPKWISTQNQRPDTPLQRWGYALLGIIFISVGGAVFVKARQRDAARAFYLFCFTTAVALALASAMYLRIDWLQSMLFITLAVWAGSFASFFLKFPVCVGKSKRVHYFILSAVALGAVFIVLGYLWVLAGNYLAYETVRMLTLIYVSACVAAGLGTLLRSLVGERSPEVRQQLFLLLGGTTIAFGPGLLLDLLPHIIIDEPIVSLDLAVLSFGFMPLAFAYAITQHQLLGIRSLMRRSVVYVVLGFSVLIVFAVAAAVVSTLLPQGWWDSEFGLIGFGLLVFLIALSFGWAQRRVERLVDRYIYHDAYDYKEALLQFSAQLASEQDLKVLADQLVERTCRLMNLTCGILLLASQPQEAKQIDRLTSALEPDFVDADSEYDHALSSRVGAGMGTKSRTQPLGEGDLYLELYAQHGSLAATLLEGLRAELAAQGIVLRQPDSPAPVLYDEDGSQAAGAETATDVLKTTKLAEAPTSFLDEDRADLETVRSFLGVPLWTRSYFIGVLCLGGKKTGERFTQDDMSLLSTLGSQAALAIYNAQLYEAREQALLDTITALAHAIEAKDTYTINHCENITDRAVALAQALALPRQEVENIRLGSILHDVGKIGIPDAILNKPSKLTDEEYETIKQHAQIGARIVQSVGALQGVVPIVRHHQERYDGQGYPDGLVGEEIPIGARIIAIVDAYGAMTEDRVYRKALGHEKAINELRRNAGTQFDPRVVNAFIRILKEQPELAEIHTEDSVVRVH
ncbi:MAG: HD domain-containing protein [Chloroflexota bacterium]|nr:HD domain-containing protein [Chloroflexota bacterium]MDQ5866744.1 HD domain-containing protein [Chloroflexota bacterium]